MPGYPKDTPRLWPRYPKAMKRLAGLALALAAAACSVGEPPSLARLVVSPVLDSIFVGDSAPARTALYYDDKGNLVGPVAPTWTSSAPTVVGVDAATGKIAGLSRGFAVVTGLYRNVQGQALVVASRPLELSLLLDTIYLMAGDHFTVPVEVKKKTGVPPQPWFNGLTPGVFTIDSATGVVTAVAPGGPVPFYAHVADNVDTLADTGAVEVVNLTDTIGGKSSYTVLGTFIRRTTSGTRAVNYERTGDTLTFRLRDFIAPGGGPAVEFIFLTSRDSVTRPDTIVVDSISIDQAFNLDPFCHPLSNWGVWSTQAGPTVLTGLSRQGGTLVIAQVDSVASGNGQVVSGWFSFVAQRIDGYDDPIWALPIRGTFVAPLITDRSPCRR